LAALSVWLVFGLGIIAGFGKWTRIQKMLMMVSEFRIVHQLTLSQTQ